jgi:hypothetical protein
VLIGIPGGNGNGGKEGDWGTEGRREGGKDGREERQEGGKAGRRKGGKAVQIIYIGEGGTEGKA